MTVLLLMTHTTADMTWQKCKPMSENTTIWAFCTLSLTSASDV